MTVQISGIEQDPRLRTRVARRLDEVLGFLQVTPVRAQVTFVDDNGPKGGPAIRCALTVRVPYWRPIRVERAGETPRLAFDAGFAALERVLERYREKDRDSKRHPKKYYAARRLL